MRTESRPTAAPEGLITLTPDDDPAASIDATRRAIATTITLDAIARYYQARDQYLDARRRIARDPALDHWTEYAAGVFNDAETQLLRAILTWRAPKDRYFPDDPERTSWPAVGIRHGGRLYLAMPDEDDPFPVGEKAPDDRCLMTLRIFDEGIIRDLAAPAREDADGRLADAIGALPPENPRRRPKPSRVQGRRRVVVPPTVSHHPEDHPPGSPRGPVGSTSG